MSNTEKLNLISGELTDAIASHCVKADEAMKTMELMNITPERFRKASESLAHHTYAGGYLVHIMSVVETGDIKKSENAMRFHVYQLRLKGTIGEADEHSKAQCEVADLLDSIVIRFFED